MQVITCLLLSYPLAAIYTRIHVPAIRHLFSIVVSLFYLIAIFQLYNGTAQLLASILTTYFICANVNGPRMPWIVFA
jgi:lysophospholipid acyltransferase